MTLYDELIEKFDAFLAQDEPSLIEMRRLMLELEEFINSDDYQGLSIQERTQLQDARKVLRTKIRQQEDENDLQGEISSVGSDLPTNTPSAVPTPGNDGNISQDQQASPPAKEHDPIAEQQMEAAEKLFYSGRYAEAINIFDRVLQLEPSWDRAGWHGRLVFPRVRSGVVNLVYTGDSVVVAAIRLG